MYDGSTNLDRILTDSTEILTSEHASFEQHSPQTDLFDVFQAICNYRKEFDYNFSVLQQHIAEAISERIQIELKLKVFSKYIIDNL